MLDQSAKIDVPQLVRSAIANMRRLAQEAKDNGQLGRLRRLMSPAGKALYAASLKSVARMSSSKQQKLLDRILANGA